MEDWIDAARPESRRAAMEHPQAVELQSRSSEGTSEGVQMAIDIGTTAVVTRKETLVFGTLVVAVSSSGSRVVQGFSQEADALVGPEAATRSNNLTERTQTNDSKVEPPAYAAGIEQC